MDMRIIEKAIVIAEEMCFRKAAEMIRAAVKLCKNRDLRTLSGKIIMDAARIKCECPTDQDTIFPATRLESYIRLREPEFRVAQDAGAVLASVVEKYIRTVLSKAKDNCIAAGMKTLHPRHLPCKKR